MGAAVMIEPPMAEKSPATGAVSTTETPAAYAFPGEELAASRERAAEKEAGADELAANALAGRRSEIKRAPRVRCISVTIKPRAASKDATLVQKRGKPEGVA